MMDWKIWALKVSKTALAVILAGGVVVWRDNPYWLLALPLLKGLENWFKHK